MAIDTYGPFRKRMEPLWDKDNTLAGGTDAMRDAGKTYLPLFEGETDKNYQRRLSLASLTNFYMKAANSMVGEIFRDPVEVSDSTIEQAILDNIDNRGADVARIAERSAENLLRKSIALIVIDHPNAVVSNLAEQRARGIRHYWTFVNPENVIDVRSTFIDGKEVMIHLRWFEDITVPGDEEFEFVAERQICVLDREVTEAEDGRQIIGPPRGRRYRQISASNASSITGAGNYEPVGDWLPITGAEEIPAVLMQANRTALFEGRPPLADIAEKNVQHWRQSSNYGNSLEIGAFPILARFGAKRSAPLTPLDADEPKADTGEILVGPHIIMNLPSTNEGADLRYVEPTGAAYDALERALDRIINEAEMMALDLLVKDGVRTATEASYDRLQQMAPLQRVANEVEFGVNRALEITAKLRGGREKSGFIAINKDFGITTSDALRVQALKDARVMGDITAETYLKELQEIGALSASLDVSKEVEMSDGGLNRNGGSLFGSQNVG